MQTLMKFVVGSWRRLRAAASFRRTLRGRVAALSDEDRQLLRDIWRRDRDEVEG